MVRCALTGGTAAYAGFCFGGEGSPSKNLTGRGQYFRAPSIFPLFFYADLGRNPPPSLIAARTVKKIAPDGKNRFYRPIIQCTRIYLEIEFLVYKNTKKICVYGAIEYFGLYLIHTSLASYKYFNNKAQDLFTSAKIRFIYLPGLQTK